MSGDVVPGDVVAFELSGGPGCGLVVEMPIKKTDTYLLGFVAGGNAAAGVEAWAYRFASRSTRRGWVLVAECCVGVQGGEGFLKINL